MPKNRKICIDAYFFYGKYARLHIFRMSLDMLKRKAIDTFESIAFSFILRLLIWQGFAVYPHRIP